MSVFLQNILLWERGQGARVVGNEDNEPGVESFRRMKLGPFTT